MPYEARIKPKSTMKNVRFSGNFEFVRYEWRTLPDEKVVLARNNPYLEIRETGPVVIKVAEGFDMPATAEFLGKGEAGKFLEADDLTAIKGVGKATASILSLYFQNFSDLANADAGKVQEILSADPKLNKLDAEDLIRQAKELQ